MFFRAGFTCHENLYRRRRGREDEEEPARSNSGYRCSRRAPRGGMSGRARDRERATIDPRSRSRARPLIPAPAVGGRASSTPTNSRQGKFLSVLPSSLLLFGFSGFTPVLPRREFWWASVLTRSRHLRHGERHQVVADRRTDRRAVAAGGDDDVLAAVADRGRSSASSARSSAAILSTAARRSARRTRRSRLERAGREHQSSRGHDRPTERDRSRFLQAGHLLGAGKLPERHLPGDLTGRRLDRRQRAPRRRRAGQVGFGSEQEAPHHPVTSGQLRVIFEVTAQPAGLTLRFHAIARNEANLRGEVVHRHDREDR